MRHYDVNTSLYYLSIFTRPYDEPVKLAYPVKPVGQHGQGAEVIVP